jgi:UMF1 family MFS transporter
MAKKREILGWATFDVANSAYTTIIVTVLFNSIFSEIIVGPDPGTEGSTATYARGNLWWSFIIAASSLLAALLSPLFGALSDVTSHRKRYLALSVGICSVATSLLWFVSPGQVWFAAILVVIAGFGFSLSENFIASFLPHIATPANIGKISGLGWGLGYFGGLGSIVLVQAVTGSTASIEYYDQLRWVGPLTGFFFILFSLPTFIFVKEPAVALSNEQALVPAIKKSYAEVRQTLRKLGDYRDLTRFLVSFTFFSGGLAIVISFAALFGKQVYAVEGEWRTIFFVSLQLTAAAGAFLFGWIQAHIGALRAVNITLAIWIATILAIWWLEPLAALLGVSDLRLMFVIIGNFAGLCLGATQASSRALVGLMAPPERSGEFFGFWGLAGKIASIVAILSFGFLQSFFDLRTAMLICSSFFIIGLLINLGVDEKRGHEAALQSS